MNLFISYFKKAPAFFISLVFVLLFEGSLYLIDDLYLIDGRGTFLTVYKRQIAENPSKSFAILLYGDSRSLSINGKNEDGLSMYNFSLPAAGPGYIRYFLKKYLTHHKKPKAVIWAVDPTQLVKTNESLEKVNPEIWKNFRHRLLNLFTLAENLEQYSGKDKFFILKESIPLILPSIEHREGLERVISGGRIESLITLNIGSLQENLQLKKDVEKSMGQLNVGNYFAVPVNDIKEKSLAQQWADRQSLSYDLSPLTEFIKMARNEDIKVIILEIPSAEKLYSSPLNQKIIQEYQKLMKTPGVFYLRFPDMKYNMKYFSEGIHYNHEGELKVNQDFDQLVWPRIKEIIKNEK